MNNKKIVQKRWRDNHREQAYQINRKYILKSYYGISPEDFLHLLKIQKGVCAICQHKDNRELSIDHVHRSNVVRGLLCRHCNLGLGNFKDNPLLLKRAIKYLKEKDQ